MGRKFQEDKCIAIIQARMGSRRLPGKVLLDLEGKSVLERVIQRVQRSQQVQEAVVATTIERDDLAIVELCAALGIRVYCGSAEDVLDRYYQAARLYKAKIIVRITADCPLIDPFVIDEVIKSFKEKKVDYASNTLKETFPDGQDVEVFSIKALDKAWKKARLPSEREHVTPYIKKHRDLFKKYNLEYRFDLGNKGNKRWTLDTIEDYKFIKKIYAGLFKTKNEFTLKDTVEYLEIFPELENINKHIIRNEGYRISLKKDKQERS